MTDNDVFQATLEQVNGFLSLMESAGIVMNIQFKIQTSKFGACVSSMGQAEALGHLEIAKSIVLDGHRAHQHFDSLVQAMEKRPDLVDRYVKVLHSAHEEKPK